MDREPMTKDKERDALIVEKKQLAYFLECKEGTVEAEAMFRRAAALLRGDEPAKLDRYVVAWQEADSAFGHCDCDRSENCPHAAAVLRKHFEPSAEVVEAAREIRAVYSVESNLTRPLFLMADFILKGDQ